MKAVHRTNRLRVDAAMCLQFLGTARDVLFVGGLKDDILTALDAHGYNVCCLLTGDHKADEARVFCALVEKALPDMTHLPQVLAAAEVDAVVLDDALEYFERPDALLENLRHILREDSRLVLMHSNVRQSAQQSFSTEGVEVLLLNAGYRIEEVEHVGEPTYRLVAKAIPLSIGQPLKRQDASEPTAIRESLWARPQDELGDLRCELESERAMREELFIALRDAQEFAEAAAGRIAGIAARRTELEAALWEQASVADAMRGTVQTLELHVADLKRGLRAANDERKPLAAALAAEQKARQLLERALKSAEATLDRARSRAAQSEEAWYSLYSQFDETRSELSAAKLALAERTLEIENARTELKRLTAEFTELQQSATAERQQAKSDLNYFNAALASAQAAAHETQRRFALAERTISDLKAQVAKGTQYVDTLLQQIAEKNEQITKGATYVKRLESELSDANCELEAVRQAALSDKIVMREYVESLLEQVAEIPALREAQRLLISQTEDLISSVQAESAQIVCLINTVQTSHFWSVKHWLNRIRNRVVRR